MGCVCRQCLFVAITSPDDGFAVVLSRAKTHTLSTRDALVTEHDVLVRVCSVQGPRHLTIHKSKHHQVEGSGHDRRGPTTTACRVTRHRSMLVFPCRRGKVGAAHTLHAPCPRRLWMHSMCLKRRARQDGRQQQGPEGGRRDSMHMAVCMCVFVWWGSRGAAGTQWGICIRRDQRGAAPMAHR